MHLLLAQKGTIADGDEAIDLGQSPGDIVFLSAADTELSAIAAASPHLALSLRVASLMSLKHPMSVDTYVGRTARHARLIVVRALGGASYFHYALEALHACALETGAHIVCLPGDDRPDPSLDAFSTLAREDRLALWAYLNEGGADNARGFLSYAQSLVAGGERPEPAKPLLKAGLWWPGRGVIGVEAWRLLQNPSPTPPRKGEGLNALQHLLQAETAVIAGAQNLVSPSPLRGGVVEGTAGTLIVAICFYRALVQSGETAPVEALIAALMAQGLRVLPVFVTSLKDSVSAGTLQAIFAEAAPDVVINATAFAVSQPGTGHQPTVLDETGAVVLQVIFSSSSKPVWDASSQGLSSRDLAMHVCLPEIDGRVLSRAVSFKSAARFDDRVEAHLVSHAPVADRVHFVAQLAGRWALLRRTAPQDRNVAIILANYPNRDGRLGNGVGLDTPAATMEVLRAMVPEGYDVADLPADGDGLINHLMAGPTNAGHDGREVRETLSLIDYKRFFASLPVKIQREVAARWGVPEADPYCAGDVFALPLARFGKVMVGIQPARGYNINPGETYHSPDLVPPHGYFAFYAFLREHFKAHAIVHMGKHGNLEWLPGKAFALSQACYPEAVCGAMPHLYPFIVNDPGEGTQAKRRTSAVIIDHLTPPLTRAESYGPLKDLETLVDEYYEASVGDPRRVAYLKRQILDLVADLGLDHDAGILAMDDDGAKLEKLDAWLCDLKEMQIRDGLHIFGRAPEGRLLTDLTVALARVPRGMGEGADQSLQRAIASDLFGEKQNPSPTPPHKGEGLNVLDLSRPTEAAVLAGGQSRVSPAPLWGGVGEGTLSVSGAFDPLDCISSDPWAGPKPDILAGLTDQPWRTHGDTVERIELLAASLVSGEIACPDGWSATRLVLDEIQHRLKPSIVACGPAEIQALLRGLDGRFVAPGPSGAPTRGRPDVLPTGRNFYSVDCRSVPTQAAWILGQKSAELLVTRYVQDHGDWPTSFALTAWGTSNMRTGGDDIAQALALIGAKPVWDSISRRVTGYEILPVAVLGRPRVDVTLRISGFFRDAFPDQIALFDKAVRAVGTLEEDAGDNAIAVRMRTEYATLMAQGLDEKQARAKAGYRVFGARPGAYGAGLQALIDEKGWAEKSDLAEAFVVWGGYAYGANDEGKAAHSLFEIRLKTVEAIVQNQDNREHDLLDSDDYYQFEGGMLAAAEHLSGRKPAAYHNDHSRPERPVIRSLEEEISRVVRGRVVNPKWIEGVMRHGYKGAFEIAATVDYMFAFAATTGAVRDHHFEAVYQAFVVDERVRHFMTEKNPAAQKEMADRLLEAMDRGLWTARSNSARFDLEGLVAFASA